MRAPQISAAWSVPARVDSPNGGTKSAPGREGSQATAERCTHAALATERETESGEASLEKEIVSVPAVHFAGRFF